MKIVTKINNTDGQQLFWRMVVFTAVLSFFVYFYVVASITFNVIERKNVENEIKNLNSHLSELELKYLSAERQINIALAKKLGFVENPDTFFTARGVLVLNQ